MSKDRVIDLVCGIGIGLAIMGIAMIFALDHVQKEWRKDAIMHNAARHNPITGEFEWKEMRK